MTIDTDSHWKSPECDSIRKQYAAGRDVEWERVSKLAGVDGDGHILPPPDGMEIDRSPTPWWK